MRGAKIQLSPAEARLVTNAEVILTKNRVVEKTWQLLESVQEQMLQVAPILQQAQDRPFSNAHAFAIPPKISRGENYGGLPYLVLDYPRIFQQHATFAIRSFFWWGHFFSSTVQLSGDYKTAALPKLEAAYPTFSAHHIDNYQPVSEMEYGDLKKLLHTQPHVKLATKLPVTDWEQADSFLLDNWKLYLEVLL
jgi:hypothetical protein